MLIVPFYLQRLKTKTKLGKKTPKKLKLKKIVLEKIHGTLKSFLWKLKFWSNTKNLLFLKLKTKKATTLQQVTTGNIRNLILKIMQGKFLKITNCDGIVLEIYLDQKFQWLQESFNQK